MNKIVKNYKKNVEDQIKLRKEIVSNFIKDQSRVESQKEISIKTGINENTLTRIKNNPNAITSFDNIVALYTIYPELNKRFQNQWIEISGIGSTSELEVPILGNLTKNFDLIALRPNEITKCNIPQNININFQPIIVYRYLNNQSINDRNLLIFSKKGLVKDSCKIFYKYFPDKLCLAVCADGSQFVGYLFKKNNDFQIINPSTRKIFKDSGFVEDVYRLIISMTDDWSINI
jgi:hypothetical protein|tara:strand:+ start:616 stop:1311 length:696 start_codon:yes stop_codon:yes gene_type:complete